MRVIVVDGIDRDAGLLVDELRRDRPEAAVRVVASEAELRDALVGFDADILLCDVAERNADHVDALGIVRALQLDLPIVLVAAAIGERGVVAALRGGAVDYVLRANLVRLPSAVEHAVREQREKLVLRRSLGEAEGRVAAHARRLETLWRIANDNSLQGVERTVAMLRESAVALRAPQRFRGFLNRIEGAELVVLAVTLEGDDENAGGTTFPAGHRLPIGDTSALAPSRTQFWDTTTTVELPAASLAIGWRSEITTRFQVGGTGYMLTFGAAVPTQFNADDVAYIEVLADSFAHQIAFDAFEQTLRDAEARARAHAGRLEALWRIASDPALHGEPLWVAMLREAAASISPGQAFEGIFSFIDGENVIRVAAVPMPATADQGGHRDPVVPQSVPLVQTFLSDLLAQGEGTHSWDDLALSDIASRVARRRHWRAAIGTTFPAAGKTYAVGFGSLEAMREPFGPLEHVYVDVLAAFFARNVQDAWIAAKRC